jgi:hypothetical protein
MQTKGLKAICLSTMYKALGSFQSSIIFNDPKLETTQISITNRMYTHKGSTGV